MTISPLEPHRDHVPRTLAIIGGGFTGSLLALKLSAAKPDWTICLIEEGARVGRGLAYGACGPEHILNVPAGRMELGLEPGFVDWLRQRPGQLAEALAESGGKLADAFVPRRLFGDYLEQQMATARAGRGGIRRIQGTAMALAGNRRRVLLEDGRAIAADCVILATGNLPSVPPFQAKPSQRIIANPWAIGVLQFIAPQTPVLLVGAGLTMVDTILSLQRQGHVGPLHAVSRHGLMPGSHRAGGSWPPVLEAGVSPVSALRIVRAHVRRAEAAGVPWQRVFDAVRPSVASIWHAWSLGQRAQFLRHLRVIWDVHRHRMTGRITAALEGIIATGRLSVTAARVLTLDETRDGVTAVLRPRGGKLRLLEVGAVINCTGPQMDLRKTAHPLLRGLLRQGVIQSDPIGLGLETEDCAVKDGNGAVSDWLYALGPLTRPAWWEIVAVPEINTQVDRLVRKFSSDRLGDAKPLPALFLDIGAGI